MIRELKYSEPSPHVSDLREIHGTQNRKTVLDKRVDLDRRCARCSSLASAETRYFRVCPGPDPSGCGSPNDFIVALSKPRQIQMAMQILGGKVVDQVHVQGMIVAKPAAYNTPWKFHLAPKTISFFTFGHPSAGGFRQRILATIWINSERRTFCRLSNGTREVTGFRRRSIPAS